MTKSNKLTIVNPNAYSPIGKYTINPSIVLTVNAVTDCIPGTFHNPEDLMNVICLNPYVQSVTLEPKLEIKVGGTYKNGADQQVKIVATEVFGDIVHYIGDDDYHYRFDGTFGFDPDERSSADLVSLVYHDPVKLQFTAFRSDQMAYGLVVYRQSEAEKAAGEYDPHPMFIHKDADIDDPAVKAKVEKDCATLARLLDLFKIEHSALSEQAIACAVPVAVPLELTVPVPDNVEDLTRQMKEIYDADRDYEMSFGDLPDDKQRAYKDLRLERNALLFPKN
jgi:hypothetical protein